MKGIIPEKKYVYILKSLPVVCVDLIIIRGDKFLLGQRREEPAKGKWFPIGGRILKNESLENAVVRKAKEELGLKIDPKKIRFLGVGETMFRENYGRHSINLIYAVSIARNASFEVKKEHNNKIAWFKSIDREWDEYVKYAVKLAGFK